MNMVDSTIDYLNGMLSDNEEKDFLSIPGIKNQIEERIPADQLLAPIEIIAYHNASAQLGLAIWWLENGKPYPPEYMSQISLWLSMVGNAQGLGLEEVNLDPPKIQ